MSNKTTKLLLNILLAFAIQGSLFSYADQNLTGTEVTSFAQKFLEKQLSEQYDKNNIEIFSTRPLPDNKLPEGKINLTLDEKEISCIGKYYTLPVIVSINDRPYKTLFINFKVKVYEEVVVAAKTLKMNQVLSREDLTISRIEVSKVSDTCKEITELLGYKTSQYIQAGKPVCYTNIEKSAIVAKNKQIKVIGKIGGIEATIYGTAMENGFKDDIIKIQNLSSQKIISARIIDNSTAELIF